MSPRALMWILLFAGGALCGTLRAAPDPVALIVGEEPGGYVLRLEAARRLSRAEAEQEAVRLRAFLETREDRLEDGARSAVQNEVVNLFLRHHLEPEALSESLQRSWQSPHSSALWKDYCLQHLGELLPRLEGIHRKRAAAILWAALDSAEENFAGTALLGLHHSRKAGVDLKALAENAIALARNPDQNVGNRLSALQVATALEDPRALLLSRELLTRRHALPLRLAALHSLGQLGDASDLERLARYHHNPIAALRQAADKAHAQLSHTQSPRP